jgi:hypothetical protein
MVVAAAKDSGADADVGTAGLVAIAAGLVCNPIMLYSEYVLKTTGAGLPPGPGGVYGALGEAIDSNMFEILACVKSPDWQSASCHGWFHHVMSHVSRGSTGLNQVCWVSMPAPSRHF